MKVQAWVAVEAGWAYGLGLTPNQVSAVGIILAFLSGFAYWQSSINPVLLVLAPILLLASGFCDALDGAIARIYGKTTPFGGLCDFSWGLIALVGSLLVSYARARAEAAGVKMETVGLAERADRLIILILASFLTLFWSMALYWSVILLAFLTNLTVLQRAYYFHKVSRKD